MKYKVELEVDSAEQLSVVLGAVAGTKSTIIKAVTAIEGSVSPAPKKEKRRYFTGKDTIAGKFIDSVRQYPSAHEFTIDDAAKWATENGASASSAGYFLACAVEARALHKTDQYVDEGKRKVIYKRT